MNFDNNKDIDEEKHIKYFNKFWDKYFDLKKEFDLALFKRKFYIDGMKNNSFGTKIQMDWINTKIENLILEHKEIIEDINKLIENFEDYLETYEIDMTNTSYNKDFFDSLHGQEYICDLDDIFPSIKCKYTREELCEFDYPNRLQ